VKLNPSFEGIDVEWVQWQVIKLRTPEVKGVVYGDAGVNEDIPINTRGLLCFPRVSRSRLTEAELRRKEGKGGGEIFNWDEPSVLSCDHLTLSTGCNCMSLHVGAGNDSLQFTADC